MLLYDLSIGDSCGSEGNSSFAIGGCGAGFFFLHVPLGVVVDSQLVKELLDAYIPPRSKSALRGTTFTSGVVLFV